MIVIVTTADGQEHNFDNATAVSINGVPLEEETAEQKWARFLYAANALENGHALYYDQHEDLFDHYKVGEWDYEVGVLMQYGTLHPILASDSVSELWDEVVSDLGEITVEIEIGDTTIYHYADASDLLEQYGLSEARNEWLKDQPFYSDEDYKVSRERDTVSDFI